MKAHLYNPLAAALSHTFKLCVDKKIHVQVIAHGWGKATCKVVGACDGTCCPQVELGEDAINMVEQFLNSGYEEGKELAGAWEKMIKNLDRSFFGVHQHKGKYRNIQTLPSLLS